VNKNAAGETILRCVNLSMFYPQTKTYALRNINISITQGEFIGIKGPSGSGKSTLLYLLAGLLELTNGSIYFREQSLSSIKNKALYRRKNIGFVFQDFYLYPGFTVLENVLFPRLHQFIIPRSVMKRAHQLLEYLCMEKKNNAPVQTLSAGERQRVCIARALMYEPVCILADEPTGNLDSHNAQNIIDMLKSINKEFNTTVILVTHDEKVSSAMQRIIHIIDGRVVDV
jgi:lipoprotein-releasing system ATP-binding protein